MRDADQALTCCWPRIGDGPPVISSWSLANAMALPAKETDPIEHAEEDLADLVDGERPGPESCSELGDRDQRGRATTDAVEDRHHLRHRGHLHEAGRRHRDRRADHHRDDDEDDVQLVIATSPNALVSESRVGERHRRSRAPPLRPMRFPRRVAWGS